MVFKARSVMTLYIKNVSRGFCLSTLRSGGSKAANEGVPRNGFSRGEGCWMLMLENRGVLEEIQELLSWQLEVF